MAAIKHARGVLLVLSVGNGASPEVFTPFCSINTTRELAFEAATNDFVAPDCSDMELVSWLAREKVSLASSFNGAGMLNTPDAEDLFDFLKDPDSRNCKITLDVPLAAGGVIWAGKYHLTTFNITGNTGEKMTANVALLSDGPVTLTAVPA